MPISSDLMNLGSRIALYFDCYNGDFDDRGYVRVNSKD